MHEDGRGELIAYRRADDGGPKVSDYLLSPTASPGTLRDALARSNGVEGRVVKHRTLFLVGRTRVHLDRVQGLGDFMETLEKLGAKGWADVKKSWEDDAAAELGG